jgi:PKD repeat protein
MRSIGRLLGLMVLLGILAAVGGCGPGTVAVIDATGLEGVVPLTVSFDGSGSSSPSGIGTYTWSFGTSDPNVYTQQGEYTYEHAGTYTLTLRVRGEDGSTDTTSVTVTVDPAVWITDANLDTVYKLDLEGNSIDSFLLPFSEPRGITVGEVAGKMWLFVACYNGGNQRILRIDPATGNVTQNYSAPAQSPLNLTYQAQQRKQIWHVDGLNRKLYRLNPPDLKVYDSYGDSYFKATSGEYVGNLPFLWTPQGLDWTPEANTSGHLWYLEGQNRMLYKIKIIPGYDIMSDTQLEIVSNPINIPIFSASAIDMYEGKLWVIDVDSHSIIEVDPETGVLTGNKITGFPGASPAGLEIQH